MKIIYLCILTLTFTACGDESSSLVSSSIPEAGDEGAPDPVEEDDRIEIPCEESTAVGEWTEPGEPNAIFRSNCSFDWIQCGVQGTWAAYGPGRHLLLTVESVSENNCLSLGTYDCAYSLEQPEARMETLGYCQRVID